MHPIFYWLFKYLLFPLVLLGGYTLLIFYATRRDLFYDLLGYKKWVYYINIDENSPFISFKVKRKANPVSDEGDITNSGSQFVFRGRPAFISPTHEATNYKVEVNGKKIKLGKDAEATKKFLRTIIESDVAGKVWGVSRGRTAIYLIGFFAIIGLLAFVFYMQYQQGFILKGIQHQLSDLRTQVKLLQNATKTGGQVIPLR